MGEFLVHNQKVGQRKQAQRKIADDIAGQIQLVLYSRRGPQRPGHQQAEAGQGQAEKNSRVKRVGQSQVNCAWSAWLSGRQYSVYTR